jgi:hypothetical protein
MTAEGRGCATRVDCRAARGSAACALDPLSARRSRYTTSIHHHGTSTPASQLQPHHVPCWEKAALIAGPSTLMSNPGRQRNSLGALLLGRATPASCQLCTALLLVQLLQLCLRSAALREDWRGLDPFKRTANRPELVSSQPCPPSPAQLPFTSHAPNRLTRTTPLLAAPATGVGLGPPVGRVELQPPAAAVCAWPGAGLQVHSAAVTGDALLAHRPLLHPLHGTHDTMLRSLSCRGGRNGC